MASTISITGRAGRDAIRHTTQDGHVYTHFSIADVKVILKKNPTKGPNIKVYDKKVTWWECVAWGTLAETCAKYIKKGRWVNVRVSMLPDKDGNPKVFDGKAKYEVLVEEMTLVGRGNDRDDQYLPVSTESKETGRASGTDQNIQEEIETSFKQEEEDVIDFDKIPIL